MIIVVAEVLVLLFPTGLSIGYMLFYRFSAYLSVNYLATQPI
jgi:hypothetical protein